MEIPPLQRKIAASDIAPDRLAGNPRLTDHEKIAEAARQFECVLVRQILSDSQKTVIPSEFSDDSTESGIYRDLITQTLADSISKSGTLGLAQTFIRQLEHATTTAACDSPLLVGPAASTAPPGSNRRIPFTIPELENLDNQEAGPEGRPAAIPSDPTP